MRQRLGFALSLLAALGIHAVILFVPRAALMENVHLPTVELELTQVAGPPAQAARPAVAVTQPIGARASSQGDVPRQPEAQPAAPAPAAPAPATPAPATPAPAAPAAAQQGSEPAEAAPGGRADAPAVDQPAADAQPDSDTQSGSGNGGVSTGLQSAETPATGSSGSGPASGAMNGAARSSTTAAVPAFIPPRPLSEILPRYPLSARRSGFEGVVKVSVLVDEKGSVAGVDVLSSSGHASLDQAVLDAYRHAPFAPALQDGKPVPGRVVIPVRFRLAKPD